MATVKQHYAEVLADVYLWMFDGYDRAVANNLEFFNRHQIHPYRSGLAVDLGAGCGFQSIPLAQLGFNVIAIDLDAKLIKELKANSQELDINAIEEDLINFPQHIEGPAELIVCMTDTILHLESKNKVRSLFHKVFDSLAEKGTFIITFRDLTSELSDLDRFISLKSDEQTILTCFLEYEPETVKVHDLVYRKNYSGWQLNKSFYRKLRLSKQWVEQELKKAGLRQIDSTINNGLVTAIASK